jgi:hypothetical protein
MVAAKGQAGDADGCEGAERILCRGGGAVGAARFVRVALNGQKSREALLFEELSSNVKLVVTQPRGWPKVTLPRGGVLHAKLTLLEWENCIRVLIGSANLTEPAYRRNQEVMTALDFGAQGNPAPEPMLCRGCKPSPAAVKLLDPSM